MKVVDEVDKKGIDTSMKMLSLFVSGRTKQELRDLGFTWDQATAILDIGYLFNEKPVSGTVGVYPKDNGEAL